MKAHVWAYSLLALSFVFHRAAAQQTTAASKEVARLDLSIEVATTTDAGLPAALRFTLTNAGNVPVEVPFPAMDCDGPDGSIRIQTVIHFDEGEGQRFGHGCGGSVSDRPTLLVRIRTRWFHLRPGEYLTFTGDARSMIDLADKPATYEYWAVYEPPALTAGDRAAVTRNGLVVPSEPVESNSLEFHAP
jgi:hypothetical protein